MRVQHAVFTSVRTGRNEGYQVAAASPGISDEQARELAQWGPSHDSLCNDLPGSESVNFHRMQSGSFCVSQTVLAGREYSGRGGQRVYTNMFLVPEDQLRRFGNSPFRVMDALLVSGRCRVPQELPTRFEPLDLVGRASPVNVANLQRVAQKIGSQKLASLVRAALTTDRLGVGSSFSGKRLFTALTDLLPVALRPAVSLTTGLKISAARDYRLTILPCRAQEQRRAIRRVQLEMLDLTDDVSTRFTPNSGWPLLIYQLLRSEQFPTMAGVIAASADSAEQNTDVLAEQMRERLEKYSEQQVLKTLSA